MNECLCRHEVTSTSYLIISILLRHRTITRVVRELHIILIKQTKSDIGLTISVSTHQLRLLFDKPIFNTLIVIFFLLVTMVIVEVKDRFADSQEEV